MNRLKKLAGTTKTLLTPLIGGFLFEILPPW
jgi:hypothetical protein